MGTLIGLDGQVHHQTPVHGLPLPPPVEGRYQPEFNGNSQYILPDPVTGKRKGWTRASTVAKVLEDTYMLDAWTRRMILIGMNADAKLMETVERIISSAGLAFGPDEGPLDLAREARTPLNNLAEEATHAAGATYAAEFGTATHAWCEAVDLELIHIHDVPEMFRPWVIGYRRALAEAGLTVDKSWTERIVLNTTYGIAGTLDRMFFTHAGVRHLGDIKTSKGMDYSWLYFAVQLAIYHGADLVLSLDGTTWEPMTALDPDTALIAHVPRLDPNGCRVVPINMGFGARALSTAWVVRRHRADASKLAQNTCYSGDIGSPSDQRIYAARLAVELSRTPAEMGEVWAQYQDIWTDDLTELGRTMLRLAAAL